MWGRKKKNKDQDPVQSLEQWIPMLYEDLTGSLEIKTMTSDALFTDLPTNNWVLLQYHSLKSEDSYLFLRSLKEDFQPGHYDEDQMLKNLAPWASILCPVIFFKDQKIQPYLSEISLWTKNMGKELLWHYSSLVVFCCTGEKGPPFYLLADKQKIGTINALLKGPGDYRQAIEPLLAAPVADPLALEDPLVMEIHEPSTFAGGLFFLPLEFKESFPRVQSRIKRVSLCRKIPYFPEEATGVCFKALIRVSSIKTALPIYYFFPLAAKQGPPRDHSSYKGLIKMILRHVKQQLMTLGLPLTAMSGEFTQIPPSSEIFHSFIFSFELFTGQHSVKGKMILHPGWISLILKKISDPWSWIYVPNRPENLLRMLLALNLQVERNQPNPVALDFSFQTDPADLTDIDELKEGFITMADLFCISTLTEIGGLLSNFLYRQGWTGASLPQLFYYLQPVNEPAEKTLFYRYRLVRFQEERLLKAMPRNMADQWRAHSPLPGELKTYEDWCLLNFKVMKECYRQIQEGRLIVGYRQKYLLNGAFKEYFRRLDLFISRRLKEEENFWKPYLSKRRELQDYFYHTKSEEAAALFYLNPTELKELRAFIPPGRLDQIYIFLKRINNKQLERDELYQKRVTARKNFESFLVIS